MSGNVSRQAVLVVDDAPEIIDVIAESLQSDYIVKAALNGHKALQLARSDDPPDLILMDILLPDQDGYQVCRRLKSEERTKDIPVIFVTVLGEEEDETKGFELGAVDYITKPISPPIVKARVKTHLNLRRVQVQLERANEEMEGRVRRRTAELEQANNTLRESEERYRVITEASLQGTCQVDAKGRITFANPATAELTGYSLAELDGLSLDTPFPPGEAKAISDANVALLYSGKPIVGENTLTRKDGSRIETYFSCVPILDESGEYTGFVGSILDITDRKRTEDALRESEEKYRDFFTNVFDFLYFHDLEGNFTEANLAFRKYFPFREGDVGRLNIKDMIPDSYKHLFDEYLTRIIEHGMDEGLMRVVTKDGHERILEYRNSLVRDSAGVMGVRGSARDITERLEAEKALKESEEKHRLILEASPDPVVLYDMEGNVIYINPAFTRVFGWTLGELLGKRVDFVPDETWPQTLDRIEQIKRGESFFGFETRRYNNKGDILDISMSSAVWLDESGVPAGSIIILRDVTDQKKMEAQLRQSQKMEAVGTLTGGVAHDFNNILTGILGNLTLAQTKLGPDHPCQRYLATTISAAERAADITKQLLTISRRVDRDTRPLDLADPIRATVRLLGETIDRRISLQTKIVPDLALVEADESQMNQVVMNLCVNARDALAGVMEVPGPDEDRAARGYQVTVAAETVAVTETYAATHAEAYPGRFVMLSVSDNGPGMPQEVRERIFEPFYTTKPVGKGTGLGLSTVYGIVKQHRGWISVYSEPGLGTTFRVYLPALEATAAEAAFKETEAQVPGGDETILWADDESVILELAREVLDELGYRVLLAEDGQHAVEVFEQRRDEIDLIILDLTMPRLSGPEAAVRILAQSPEAKIIISSGHLSAAGVLETMNGFSAKAFISKPYRLRDLAVTVRKVLDE